MNGNFLIIEEVNENGIVDVEVIVRTHWLGDHVL